jgi:hypothetical protein
MSHGCDGENPVVASAFLSKSMKLGTSIVSCILMGSPYTIRPDSLGIPRKRSPNQAFSRGDGYLLGLSEGVS